MSKFAHSIAGLVRWELRSLRWLLVGLCLAQAALFAAVLLAVPVQLEMLTRTHAQVAAASTLLVGLGVAAQVFVFGEGASLVRALRSAPVGRLSVLGSKLIALMVSLALLWCVAMLAICVLHPFGPEARPDDLDPSTAFRAGVVGRSLVLFGVAGYAATIAIALGSRSPLAAMLGGLVLSPWPWLAEAGGSRIRGDGPAWIHGVLSELALQSAGPIGLACALLALAFAFRLRGSSSRPSVARGLRTAAAACGFMVAVPLAGWAMEASKAPMRFDSVGHRVLGVHVDPLRPRAVVALRDAKRLVGRSRVWLLDSPSAELKLLVDPTAMPRHAARLQSLEGFRWAVNQTAWDPQTGDLVGSLQAHTSVYLGRSFRMDVDGNRVVALGGWQTGRSVDEWPVEAEGRVVVNARQPNVAHYLGTDGALHRFDRARREDAALPSDDLVQPFRLEGSPDGRWGVVFDETGPDPLLVNFETKESARVAVRGVWWTKRAQPLLTRADSEGYRWTLRGIDGEASFDVDVACFCLYDLDGSHWIGAAPNSALYLFDENGATLRRLR